MATNLTNLRPVRKPVSIQIFRGEDARQMRFLRRTFWLGVAALFIYGAFASQPAWFESDLGGMLIAAAALIPVYLWCSGKVRGVPIYPLYALTFLWTYAMPLASSHPGVILYSSSAHLLAAFTVAGFLLLGTAVWTKASRYPLRVPKSVRTLDGKAGETFFFIALALGDLFVMSAMGGWLDVEGGVFSLLRGVLLSLSSLATFVLCYQWGKGELPGIKNKLLIILLLAALLSNIMSLFLIASLSTLVLSGIAYTLGRGRVPWLPLLVILICLITLHSGKAAMRNKYWEGPEPQAAIQPWQYPARLAEWASFSLEHTLHPEVAESVESHPFFERASLVHLLLMVQEKSPQDVPYMMGTSYTIVPLLLIPRFLMPDKPTSHEGTYQLNIHYSLQTREQALGTTLGWGLLNEAYANFGFMGCVMLAIFLGSGYGLVSRWSLNAPILSFRFLFAVLVLSMSFQTEFSAGVFFTVLFQSAVPLLGVALFFMKPRPLNVTAGAAKK